ncbi:MAG: hypothetical protein ACOY5W_09070 [Pseudomonadota bacterium]
MKYNNTGRISRLSLVLLIAITMNGCAASFKRPPEDAYYGPPPDDYEESIREYFSTRLKDPDSARYEFGKPRRAYINHALIQGGGVQWFGYAVDVIINAKNSYGGYVGRRKYFVFFRGNKPSNHSDDADHPLIHVID